MTRIKSLCNRRKMGLNLYLAVYEIVLVLALVLLNHKENTKHLFELMLLGTVVSLGCAGVSAMLGAGVASFEPSVFAYRMMTLIFIEDIYICVRFLQEMRKAGKIYAGSKEKTFYKANYFPFMA